MYNNYISYGKVTVSSIFGFCFDRTVNSTALLTVYVICGLFLHTSSSLTDRLDFNQRISGKPTRLYVCGSAAQAAQEPRLGCKTPLAKCAP